MERCERIKRSSDIYHQLSNVRDEITDIFKGNESDEHTAKNKSILLSALRAKMTCLEHQIALLRLIQAEDRLQQYVWRAIFGILGAGIAWLSHIYIS